MAGREWRAVVYRLCSCIESIQKGPLRAFCLRLLLLLLLLLLRLLLVPRGSLLRFPFLLHGCVASDSMRRTTLGGLSPAQLNARGGAGGGGGAGRISGLGGKSRLLGGGGSHAAPGAGAGAVDNRLSAGSQRRSSSLYGAVSSKGPPVKSDPRPLTDKGYQQQCIRVLLNYLSSHGYTIMRCRRSCSWRRRARSFCTSCNSSSAALTAT